LSAKSATKRRLWLLLWLWLLLLFLLPIKQTHTTTTGGRRAAALFPNWPNSLHTSTLQETL